MANRSRKALRNFFHIFPYDGVSRIRFAGQGVCSPNLSRKHPTPRRRFLYAVMFSIPAEKQFVKYPAVWYNCPV